MRKIINISLIAVSFVLFMSLLLTIGAGTAKSQSEKAPSGMDISLSREEIPRLVEIIRIWKLVDELELNEEQLLGFLPRLRELDDLRGGYYRNRRDTIKSLDKLLKDSSPEDQLKSAVDRYRDMDTEYFQKRDKIRDLLYSELSVKQQAKYVVFEDSYRRDIGNLIKKLREISELREAKPQHQPVLLQQQQKKN